jgi:multicomponent Na+:H+ antiporter subunit B
MISLILRSAARFLMSLLLLFSVFLLLAGHDEPGGGFIGGLVASSAFVLFMVAYGVRAAREVLRVDPRTLIGIGLLLAVCAGVTGLLVGGAFLEGVWQELGWGQFRVKLGSPLVFDIGVYLTVIGVTLTVILSLSEE